MSGLLAHLTSVLSTNSISYEYTQATRRDLAVVQLYGEYPRGFLDKHTPRDILILLVGGFMIDNGHSLFVSFDGESRASTVKRLRGF